jgi:CheY-like chemotaxis protein
MSKEVLERALDPFFTTKEQGKGTGLGLSMVYSTVKAHRGQMDILSEPGKGTQVLLRFPVAALEIRDPEPPGEGSSRAAEVLLMVLVVDDDELVRGSTRAILEVLGHSVSEATCGEEALEMIHGGLRPDVVLLDINMPGLGGFGTLPRLRDLLPAVPVLLATGRADQSALDLIEAYPRVTLLAKPFGKVQLHRQLVQLGRG